MFLIPKWIQKWTEDLWSWISLSDRDRISRLRAIQAQSEAESEKISEEIKEILTITENRMKNPERQSAVPGYSTPTLYQNSSHYPPIQQLAYTSDNVSSQPYAPRMCYPNTGLSQYPSGHQQQYHIVPTNVLFQYGMQNQPYGSQNPEHLANMKKEKKKEKEVVRDLRNKFASTGSEIQNEMNKTMERAARIHSTPYIPAVQPQFTDTANELEDQYNRQNVEASNAHLQELQIQREKQKKELQELEEKRKSEEREKSSRLENEYNELLKKQELNAQSFMDSISIPRPGTLINDSSKIVPFVPSLTTPTNNLDEMLKKRAKVHEDKLKLEEKAAEDRLKKVATTPTPTSPNKFDFKEQSSFSIPKLVDSKQNSSFEVLDKPAEINVPKTNKTTIGFFGLRDSGKSRLITALCGCDKKFLNSSNFVDASKNIRLYEIDHPNGGFLGGSINENKPIYQEFFEKSNLANLSCLLITTNGQLREEDIFVGLLAKEYNIPCAFLRTKSDEWLDSFCEKRKPSDEKKRRFKDQDLKFVHDTLEPIDATLIKIPVFILSALVLKNPKMKDYAIDEGKFLEFLKRFGANCDNLSSKPEVLATEITHGEVGSSNMKLSPNIALIGRVSSGKSSILDAIRGITASSSESALIKKEININGKSIVEITYPDLGPSNSFIDDIISQNNISTSTKIYLVIGNAVGERDLALAKYFQQNYYQLVILLTQSDQHLDNMSEDKNVTKNHVENYKIQHLEAATGEFTRFGLHPNEFTFLNVCSPVIRDLVNRKTKNLRYQLDEEEFIRIFNI